MLESLKITNFQIHRKLEIDLDERITTIVGPSDRGKSSILRAIRWLVTNRPAGNAFIRHGSSSSEVSLRVDGRTVQRIKTDRQDGNLYKLDDQAYQAFGADVPSAVTKTLNLDGVNLQSQHSAPFWFSLSPGEVSKQLNQIVNLDLIDRTLANLAAEQRKGRAAIGVSEERLQAAREQRDGLEWTKEADAKLKEVESKFIKLVEIRDKRSRLAADLEKLGECERDARNAADAIVAWQTAEEMGEQLLALRERIGGLRHILDGIAVAEGELKRTRADLAAASKELAAVKACPVCGSELKTPVG
jgi:exonuclease SbcC